VIDWQASEASETLSGVYKFEKVCIYVFILYRDILTEVFWVMTHEITDDILQLLSHALMRMPVTIDLSCSR